MHLKIFTYLEENNLVKCKSLYILGKPINMEIQDYKHDLHFAGYYYGCGEIIICIILDVV